MALAVGLVLVGAAQASRDRLPVRPAWLPPLWYRIGVCETGLDWRWHTRDYQGAFGFYYGTWDQYAPSGFPRDADRATPRQQLRVAQSVARAVGLSAWGCWTRQDALGAWVRHG